MNDIKLSAPQLQLRRTRAEFRSLINEMKTDSFPRSMTMKLLMSAGGQRAITHLLSGISRRSAPMPRVAGFLRSIAMSGLMKLLWSTIIKK